MGLQKRKKRKPTSQLVQSQYALEGPSQCVKFTHSSELDDVIEQEMMKMKMKKVTSHSSWLMAVILMVMAATSVKGQGQSSTSSLANIIRSVISTDSGSKYLTFSSFLAHREI